VLLVLVMLSGRAQGQQDPHQRGVLTLNEVLLRNPSTLSLTEIRKIMDIKRGQPMSREKAVRAADSLRNHYRDNYYYNAKIKWSVVPAPQPGWIDFVLDIEEGPRGVVTELVFDGNHGLAEPMLIETVSVKPNRSWWTRWTGNDVFFPEKLLTDHQLLEHAYRTRGYMEAAIAPPTVQQTQPFSVRIEWRIEEGPQYRVNAIRLVGKLVYPDDEMRKWISLRPTDLLTPMALVQATSEARWGHKTRGYPDVNVTASWRSVAEAGWADVTLQIEPGPRKTVRHVRIEGNRRTQDRVILRSIDVEQGRPYNEAEIVQSRRRLERLPLFGEVSAAVSSAANADECDVTFAVKEKNTGRVQTGVTAGNVEGGGVLLTLSDANFSFHPPFRGAGYRLALNGQYGPKYGAGDLTFFNPRLWDSSYYFSVDLSYRDIKYLDNSSSRSFGPILQIGRSLGRYHQISLAYEWIKTDVYDIDTQALPEFAEDEEPYSLASIMAQYTFSTLDTRFRPKKGVHTTITAQWGNEVLGGDTELYSAEFRSSIFWSPGLDHIVNLRATFSGVESYGSTETVPLPLRAFLGGPRDLRGFSFQSVSPLDEEGNAVGGRTAYFAALEYTIPIPFISWMDGSVYYDIGNVTEDAFDLGEDAPVSDVGVGLMVRAENFPVRVDWATPLEVNEGDTENKKGDFVFSFSVGYDF
jgi:outer membrane protein insertion porin family